MKSKRTTVKSKAKSTPAGMLDDFFTPQELCAEIHVAEITLARWRLQRQGPPVTWLGRRVLYRKSSVREWLAAQEKQWAATG